MSKDLMIQLERISQLVGHCGPASVSMMLRFFGEEVNQNEIVVQAGLSESIENIGSRMDQVSLALSKLAPTYIMLGKFLCTEDDIDTVVNRVQIPLGVEWQGIFENSSQGRFEIGHYSVINGYSKASKDFSLVDPDDESVYSNGSIPKEVFLPRWWETNIMNDGKRYSSQRFSFVVIPKNHENQLRQLGFRSITHKFILDFSNPAQQ
ncbi:MAG: C39 family peptidase [Hyphomicrobiales bacterium]|uniref:C39 family peptidase n=1 Tax=Alphaproteobacteria TaxID=28211 RepID=UPI003264FDDA